MRAIYIYVSICKHILIPWVKIIKMYDNVSSLDIQNWNWSANFQV